MELSKKDTKRLGECLAQIKNLTQEVEGILDKNEIKIPTISKSRQKKLDLQAYIMGQRKSPIGQSYK